MLATRRLPLASAILLIASLLPALASAQQPEQGPVCLHPFSGGGTCFQLFAVVSFVYATIASSYGFGALLILKPRLMPKRFAFGLAALVPVTWLAALLGFTLGGAMGLLKYPHDASPFFFMDWFAASITLVCTSLFVFALYKVGRRD